MPATFIKSAVELNDLPPPKKAEIALAGRSNAGKSSFLNAVVGQKIAKVSSAPGKTRLLNFFDAGSYRWVDMPGYGFSKRSGEEQMSWHKMIEPYIETRECLVGIILIMDIRRDWSKDEDMLVDYFTDQDRKWALALTKSDQLKKPEIEKIKQKYEEKFKEEPVFLISSKTREGISDLEESLYRLWVKPVEKDFK